MSKLLKLSVLLISINCLQSTEIEVHAEDTKPDVFMSPNGLLTYYDDVSNTYYVELEDGNRVISTDKGCPKYWEASSFPLIVVVNDSLPYDVVSDIRIGVERWNRAVPGGGIFEIVYASGDDIRLTEALFRHIVIVVGKVPQIDNDDNSTYIGLARSSLLESKKEIGVYHSSNIIIADTLVGVQIETVVAHELGHALSLYHDDEDFSVMKASIDLQNAVIDDRDAQRVGKMRNGTLPSMCFM